MHSISIFYASKKIKLLYCKDISEFFYNPIFNFINDKYVRNKNKSFTASLKAHSSASRAVTKVERNLMLSGVSIGGSISSHALLILILLMISISCMPGGSPWPQVNCVNASTSGLCPSYKCKSYTRVIKRNLHYLFFREIFTISNFVWGLPWQSLTFAFSIVGLGPFIFQVLT